MQHPRFGENPQPRTLAQIADVTTWIEAQTHPFTTMEAFRACSAAATTYKASYTTTYKTMLELRDKDLLRQMNDPVAHTGLWLQISQINSQETRDAR